MMDKLPTGPEPWYDGLRLEERRNVRYEINDRLLATLTIRELNAVRKWMTSDSYPSFVRDDEEQSRPRTHRERPGGHDDDRKAGGSGVREPRPHTRPPGWGGGAVADIPVEIDTNAVSVR